MWVGFEWQKENVLRNYQQNLVFHFVAQQNINFTWVVFYDV